MGYELLINLKEPLVLLGVNINELEDALVSTIEDIEDVKFEIMLLVGKGFQRNNKEESYNLEEDTREYIQRLKELFENYGDCMYKKNMIELAIANKDFLEESY